MDRERWQQIDPLLKSALSLPDEERARFLAEACGSDEELRREVESLVAHERAAERLEAPVAAEAARLFAGRRAGETVGGYRIVEPIGAGGMGEVYLALQQRTGRRVALKLLPGHFTGDAQRVRRFQQEARAVLALNHPNIVTVYDIEQEDGVHLIASELIEGETLRRRMSRAPLNVLEALDVAAQVAAALSAAHEAGVVHRDVKPENLMVRPDGYVKVLDFGLAKLTRLRNAEGGMRREEGETLMQSPQSNPRSAINNPQLTGPGVVMGTVAYMSPEQARGVETDARTDIWSLGVVLYELLAGRAPFAGETAADVLAAILEKEPPPLTRFRPAASESLEWLVAKALTKDREGRYQTAREFAADLKRLRRRLELQAEAEHEGDAAASPASDTPVVSTDSGRRAATTAEASAEASSAPHLTGRLTRPRLWLTTAVVLLVLAAAYAVYRLTRTSPPPDFRSMRVSQLNDTGQATDAAVSPDGRLIASNYLVSGPNAVFRIALLPFEGGPPLKVFDVVGSPIRVLGWTRDGRALTHIETRGGVSNITTLPLDGSPPARLTNFKSDYIDSFAWSRDGRRLALARANSTSSVVLIGGFN
jgi:serine/threonine protein kinase